MAQSFLTEPQKVQVELDMLREALKETSDMLEAVSVQLQTWGHHPVVNVERRLRENAALALLPKL